MPMFDEIAQKIPTQSIQYQQIKIDIKRLDLVHPQISGNKFFKLKYNFLEAQKLGYRKILTFGGAYSNHIAATAFAAHHFGFESVGIIRGQELVDRPLNTTLQTAQKFQMKLHFVSREQYRLKQQHDYLSTLKQEFSDHYIIPEGGTNSLAILGCQEILNTEDKLNYDLICCAVGTGGTIAGLIESITTQQSVLGFSALKGHFLNDEVAQLLSPEATQKNWKIIDDYCQGGYAKTSTALLQFMQQFEATYAIPLEQVYTAKMLYGLFNLIDEKQIDPAQRILVLHTGGLQGKLQSA